MARLKTMDCSPAENSTMRFDTDRGIAPGYGRPPRS
jgi:hypothetical protein